MDGRLCVPCLERRSLSIGSSKAIVGKSSTISRSTSYLECSSHCRECSSRRRRAVVDAVESRLAANWTTTPIIGVNLKGESPADGFPFLTVQYLGGEQPPHGHGRRAQLPPTKNLRRLSWQGRKKPPQG